MQVMPKHIFWPFVNCSSLYAIGVTRNQSVVLRRIGGRGHFRHVTKMAVKPFDLLCSKTPAIRTLHGSTFYRTGVIAN